MVNIGLMRVRWPQSPYENSYPGQTTFLVIISLHRSTGDRACRIDFTVDASQDNCGVNND
jgi:hypothetical protein